MSDDEPYGSMTPAIAATAGRVRRWMRVIAVGLGTLGALLLVLEMVGIATAATRFAEARPVLLAIGSSYTAIAIVLLVQAFLLFRCTDHLAIASRQKRSAPLVDAARYENGYWWLTAAMILVLVAGTLFVFATVGVDVIFEGIDAPRAAAQTRPQADEDLKAPFVILAAIGLLLVGSALRP